MIWSRVKTCEICRHYSGFRSILWIWMQSTSECGRAIWSKDASRTNLVHHTCTLSCPLLILSPNTHVNTRCRQSRENKIVRCVLQQCADRSHPLLTHWLLSPAAPGPPLSIPSSLPRAGAWKKLQGVIRIILASIFYPNAQLSVCKHPGNSTYVWRAVLVQLMRFLSLIFSRINKALVSWPCEDQRATKWKLETFSGKPLLNSH